MELTFTIDNNTISNKTCIMFGANINLATVPDPFAGRTAGILPRNRITPDFGVSYTQVLYDSVKNPFTVSEMRMQSANVDQVTNGILVSSFDVFGDSRNSSINIDESEYQESLQISRIKKEFHITQNVYFSFVILPLTTLVLTLYITKRVNLPLRYQEEEVSNYPLTGSGLKPLMIKNKGDVNILGYID